MTRGEVTQHAITIAKLTILFRLTQNTTLHFVVYLFASATLSQKNFFWGGGVEPPLVGASPHPILLNPYGVEIQFVKP